MVRCLPPPPTPPQWFALIREPAGGVDPEPTADDPHPKLTRLRKEFSDSEGDADVTHGPASNP